MLRYTLLFIRLIVEKLDLFPVKLQNDENDAASDQVNVQLSHPVDQALQSKYIYLNQSKVDLETLPQAETRLRRYEMHFSSFSVSS
jgi:hypothetical protein